MGNSRLRAQQPGRMEVSRMFKKILVAVDRTDIAERVLERAIALAKAMHSQLMLVHVLSGDDSDVPHPLTLAPGLDYYYSNPELLRNYREQWSQYEQEGLERLRWLAAKAHAKGIESVEWSQPAGNPGRAICDLARSWDADAIAIGRRGRRGLSELLLGSVSNYVTHNARCSILLIGPQVAPLSATEDEASGSQPAVIARES